MFAPAVYLLRQLDVLSELLITETKFRQRVNARCSSSGLGSPPLYLTSSLFKSFSIGVENNAHSVTASMKRFRSSCPCKIVGLSPLIGDALADLSSDELRALLGDL